ncbi:NAD-dependent epimerase/dehydratase family protein [Yersinia sp. J1]|uniref:NAD-dependent epimerase/dehydratase family protein n=1 Tax=Yersinia sp. J1 TaxID=3424774 RepID=UPI003D35FD8D
MKIALTGGTGYIGSFLIPKLIEKYGVIYNIGRDKITSISADGEIEYAKFSIDSLTFILNELSPDLIVNLAAGYYKPGEIPDLNVIDGNLKIPFILLEYFKKRGNGRFVNIGSYWEFSHSIRNVEGVNPYGIIKSVLRDLLKYYSSYNVKYTNIMLYGTYGENDNRGKILDAIINSAKDEMTLKLSPGEQKLNLVYIEDVVNAIMDVVCSESENYQNNTLSIFNPHEYSVKDIVELVNKNSNRRELLVDFGFYGYREDEVLKPEYKFENIGLVQDKLESYIIQCLDGI